MNQFFPNPNLQNTASISDLAETFHTEFNQLRQQACTINNALNAYVQIAKMQNTGDIQDILSKLGLSSENVSQMHKMDSRFSRINDIIEEIVQSHFYEHTALSSKYEMELEGCRKELSNYREANIDFRTEYEQEKTHWSLEKQALEEKVRGLTKELADSRAALVENVTTSANEEKVNKKKMEMWFERRLDAVEHRILDLKEAPQDEKKFDELLRKVRGLKKKQPWNGDKKRPNLMLDDAVLNQRSEVYSNGTSTPYSHYEGVLSSAATENNLLDKGFVCSVNNSFPATHRSQNSFLSEPPSTGMKDTKQRLLESAVRRLHDSRVSFSEKEKLFCDVFKGTPSRNDALMHVKLDDILNAGNISKSVDSLSLDLKSNGKPKYTFMFNQKLRLDDLKDTKLEKAISTIQSQGSQKSSDMFGSFKRSKSFDGSQPILTNLEQLMELNLTNGDKQEPPSAIDQGIIQEMSIIPKSLKGKESDKSMKSLFIEENTLKLEEIGSNIIKMTSYKDKKGGSSRFEEQLVNNSSLVDDDFRQFLGGQKDDSEPKPFKRNSKDLKSSGKGLTINSKISDLESSHNALEKLLNNLDLGSQKIVRASGRNMTTPEQVEKADDILWGDAISKNKNDNKVADRKNSDENSEKRRPLTINTEEKADPRAQNLSIAPVKISEQEIQEIQESNPVLEGGYTPQRSHETSMISQFRPPSNGKHRHLRSSLSLVENIKDKLSRMNERKSHKYRHSQQFSSIMQDMSIDGEQQEQQNNSRLKTKNGSNFNQSLDCKSLSFSIEQEQKFVQPPRAQFQTKMNSLLGRNTHTRQKTVDAFPPQKNEGEHFIRSSFAQNQSQISFHSGLCINSPILNSSNFIISCPSSKNSTQEAQFAQLVNSNHLNLLKKLLPVGSGKRYPTPIDQNDQKLSNKDYNKNPELIEMARDTAVGSRPSCTSSEDQAMNKKPIKPCTPTKNRFTGDSNIMQKKPQKNDENKVANITKAGVALASGGSNQFRARMFAPKKNVDRENDVLH